MTVFLSVFIVVTLLAIFHIIMYGSRASRSLSWILILLLLPILGALLYAVFGINRRRIKIYPLKETTRRKLYDFELVENDVADTKDDFPSVKGRKLANLMRKSALFPAYRGNKVKVLQHGEATFETIFTALEKAERFIHLQYYIFEKGELLDRLYEIFSKKIQEGVEIRILYDAIGSFSLPSKEIKRFKELGISIYKTMPLRYGSFLFTLNYRNHRKIIIIDGIVGFTGGMNVSDKYIKSEDHLGIWDDTHVKMEGPVVDGLHRIFIKDFFFASENENLLKESYLPQLDKVGDTVAQIVSSGPDSDHPSIMQQYIAMINLAEESIYISNPYFIPNTAMLESIRIAALGGVEVKILIPLKSDSWLAKHSMMASFEELLYLGVEIYVQKDNFLHSKLIVLDCETASIGSGNFDHRSFEHNFETNALIYSNQVSQQIADDFIKDCESSEKLEYDTFKNRPFKQKLSEGFARFFSPLL